MASSATYKFFNDWATETPVNVDNEHMADTHGFPALVRIPGGGSKAGTASVESGVSVSQSWFALKFRETLLQINIGTAKLWQTGIRKWDGPRQQAGVLLAPTSYLAMVHCFYFITGPGGLLPVVNSILNANIGPILTWVRTEKPSYPISYVLAGHNLSFTVTLKDIRPTNLRFDYFGISRNQIKNSIWNIRATATFDGTVECNVDGLERNVKVEGLSVLLVGTFETQGLKMPKIHIDTLQVSIKSLPVWVADALAAQINTDWNSAILELINSHLRDAASTEDSTPNPTKEIDDPTSSPKVTPAVIWKAPTKIKTGATQFSTWMSNEHIQGKRLHELKLPGTHDSIAYSFKPLELCTRLYGETKFLRDLSPGIADPNRPDPTAKPYHLGPEGYAYVLSQVELLALAHDETKTILQQLEDGIRVFDIRIYYDTEKLDIYTEHTLRGPSFEAIVAQIRSFLDRYADSQELLIFQLSHSDLPSNSEWLVKISDRLHAALGDFLYVPDGATGQASFNFQSLKDKTLSEITKGKPKVLFANIDGVTYPHSVLNVPADTFFPGSGESGGLYGRWLSYTPSDLDTLEHALVTAANPQTPKKFLQRVSRAPNAQVKDILAREPAVNVFFMDWYTESSGDLPVPLIIKANGK